MVKSQEMLKKLKIKGSTKITFISTHLPFDKEDEIKANQNVL